MPSSLRTRRGPGPLARTLLPLLILLLGCPGSGVATDPALARGGRVLFVGNSLTYVHDVPKLVAAIAGQYGDTTLHVVTIAFPDYSLEDHRDEGSALAALRRERWNFVVMQQGPSALPESQEHLKTWAQLFSRDIRAAGAEPVLYQVWPHSGRAGDITAVDLSYRTAAALSSAMYAPAGNAWYRAIAEGVGVPLYSSDGLHASPAGAYLAAVVISSRLLDRDPLTLPAVAPGLDLDAATVRALQRAAAWALANAPVRP